MSNRVLWRPSAAVWVTVALCGLLWLGFVAALFAQDSTAAVAAETPGAILGPLGTLLVAVGASLGTAAVGKGARWVDHVTGSIDGAFRRNVGPALPLVTAAWAVALPLLAGKLGLGDVPAPDAIAAAPTSAVLGIALREAARRWVLPKSSRWLGQ